MQRLGNLIFGGGNQTLGKGNSTLVYKTFLPFGGQGEFGIGNKVLGREY